MIRRVVRCDAFNAPLDAHLELGKEEETRSQGGGWTDKREERQGTARLVGRMLMLPVAILTVIDGVDLILSFPIIDFGVVERLGANETKELGKKQRKCV